MVAWEDHLHCCLEHNYHGQEYGLWHCEVPLKKRQLICFPLDQFCGSSVLCCRGTAEAVGGEVKGRFFKGETFSPKQHGAQPC